MTKRMQSLVGQYLAYRRSLGFSLHAHGQLLVRFARFADRSAPGQPITAELALRWIGTFRDTAPSYRTLCLKAVRTFAHYCVTIDPRTELMAEHQFGPPYRRRAPHIFSAEEVHLLMDRARRLPARGFSLRPLVFETLVGLLACTGLRIGEALRLQICDFDGRAGILRVPRSKYGAERFLPLHPSSVRALARYREQRLCLCPFGEHLFVGPSGRPLVRDTAHRVFSQLARGLLPNGDHPHPRWHDLRHGFATHWVATWSRRHAPVAHHLLLLSRYLGHRCFGNTWWYVSADRSALENASQRFFRHHHANSKPHNEL